MGLEEKDPESLRSSPPISKEHYSSPEDVYLCLLQVLPSPVRVKCLLPWGETSQGKLRHTVCKFPVNIIVTVTEGN